MFPKPFASGRAAPSPYPAKLAGVPAPPALVCTVFAALLTVVAAQLCGANEPPPARKTPCWERIVYPKLPIPGEAGQTFEVWVESTPYDGKSQLRFDVLWFSKTGDPQPASLAKDKIVVLLHRPDGGSIQPKDAEGPNGIRSRAGVAVSLTYPLPWGPNALDEAWIEMQLPGQKYWFEIPYGFTRDPDAAPPPADVTRDGPEFAPAMKNLPKEDRLVPWLHVDYDLGEIQNHVQLRARMANRTDGHADMALNRDITQILHGMAPWKIDSPKTAMKILDARETIDAHCTNIHLDEIGAERVDTFDFNRDPSSHRFWGTAVFTVKDKEYRFSIPSSLFKYGHADADPQNPQWVKR